MDEQPVPHDPKRWKRLERMTATMGVSALAELIDIFKPEHKHVVEESRYQQDRRVQLPSPDGPAGKERFGGTISLPGRKRSPRGTEEEQP